MKPQAELRRYERGFDALAHELGLDFWPLEIDLVPAEFMMEISVYGLPVRLPHWSFGVRYIHRFIQHRMGHSKLYEVVFPGNPGQAYLAATNSIVENALVIAHVLGHADFSKNNYLFRSVQEQQGFRIVEQAATHARRIGDAIEIHGADRVEQTLDAALALEQHIDWHKALHRPRYPELIEEEAPPEEQSAFQQRFDRLVGEERQRHAPPPPGRRAPIPPYPERDLLWFIAHYAPEMEPWERDIFLTVREESFYFYPVFACQIINEGWASYWHARLMREADFLEDAFYLEAMKTHSDVVRPYAGEAQVALAINPYHLGFILWNKIVEEQGMERAWEIRKNEDDFAFVRNHLDEETARELGLFRYISEESGRVTAVDSDIDGLHETLLADRYNYAAPHIVAEELERDGTLRLRHDHETDSIGLDLERTRKVLQYIEKVWRRPVEILTLDGDGDEICLSA